MTARAEVLARERRWALPTAILTMLGIVLLVLSIVVLSDAVSGDTDPEVLTEADEERGTVILGYILRTLGISMLAIPLAYLFRAALARNPDMRGQLIGVVFAGPIFLGLGSLAEGLTLLDAGSEFADSGLPLEGEEAEDRADALQEDSSWRGLAVGLSFGGAIGYAVALFYTAMHAMRTGLLSRFWGSMGMALGVVSILFFPFTLLWIIFVGLLIVGWVPGGRPPAWETGEALPWPSPGEEMATSMEEPPDDVEDPPTEQDGDGAAPPGNAPRRRGERRKRKRRR